MAEQDDLIYLTKFTSKALGLTSAASLINDYVHEFIEAPPYFTEVVSASAILSFFGTYLINHKLTKKYESSTA